QPEYGIRDSSVTGVQTCALPIWIPSQVRRGSVDAALIFGDHRPRFFRYVQENAYHLRIEASSGKLLNPLSGELERGSALVGALEIGRASCRERVEMSVGVCRLYM